MKQIIPQDIHLAWSRDFSFLNTFIIAYQHVHVLERYVGRGYLMCIFVYNDGQIDFYRSVEDESNFNKFVGEKCLRDSKYLNKIVANLRKVTDEFNSFLESEKSLNKENLDIFIILNDLHFAYLVANYCSADYIAVLPQNENTKKVFNLLDETRKYNEMVYPNLEKWLIKQEFIILLTREELILYIKEGTLPSDHELKQREKKSYVLFGQGQTYFSSGDSAKNDEKGLKKVAGKYLRQSMEYTKVAGAGIAGGVYRGKVKKIEKLERLSEVQAGDVLVTKMTRPSYNHLIKKAGAIVTDEGAVLSHAAIVAREFNIPAVIGTKTATQILNDGDEVEVDADNGVVNIIEKVG